MGVPVWVDLIKTGVHKELSPYNPDWYYIRCASTLRHLYIRGGVGVKPSKRFTEDVSEEVPSLPTSALALHPLPAKYCNLWKESNLYKKMNSVVDVLHLLDNEILTVSLAKLPLLLQENNKQITLPTKFKKKKPPKKKKKKKKKKS